MTEDIKNTIQEPAPEDIVHLDAAALQWRQEHGRLQLRQTDEEEWREVQLFRLFPLSEPERWIAVVDKDNKEIGILSDLHHCPHEPLGLIRHALAQRYMVPHILRIVSCRDRFDISIMELETDRGPVTIQLRRHQENILRPLPHRVTLIDIESNRYDIPDINALDEVSRTLLEERI